MAYSKAKLKSSGDRASPCSKPFLIGNLSDTFLPTRTLLYVSLRLIFINLTSLLGIPNLWPDYIQDYWLKGFQKSVASEITALSCNKATQRGLMDSGDDRDTVFPRYVLYSSPMNHKPVSTSPKRFFHSKVILLLELPQTFPANETATCMWGNTDTYATRGIVRARGRYGVGRPTARSCGAII